MSGPATPIADVLELLPLSRRARDLATSGNYDSFDRLEAVLIVEYGLIGVNELRVNSALHQELADICETAYARRQGQ